MTARMPTSTTASPEPRHNLRYASLRRCSGFTLLELSLALLIIAVVLMLAIPRLRDPGRAELVSQARRLVLIYRLLRSEAVLSGQAYRLNYDLNQQRYWVTGDASADLDDIVHELGSLARGTKLDGQVTIVDIVLPTLAGKVNQGLIYTVFYPDGSVDPTVIHLASPREAYTLWLNPMNGRLNIAAGYHDVEYAG